MDLGLSKTPKKAAIPPSDAATLIIVRFDGPSPRLLMGQRHLGHVFMPGKFVFPGGRLEREDGRKAVAGECDPVTIQKLMLGMRGKPSLVRARGLLVAAARETYEETGLQVGHRGPQGPADLTGLVYVARAITPPGRPRRFDSRFFTCNARLVTNLDAPHALASPELLTLNWVTLAEALELNLPSITRDILGILAPFLAKNTLPPKDCPVSFHHNRGTSWVVEQLSLHKT
jgi:8-oxo-dGTP pyrophosphatase MutT (NUDIX family)